MTGVRVPTGNVLSLDSDALQGLEQLLNQDGSGSDWMELAKRLGLCSLVETYKDTPSPSVSLLRSYEVRAGPYPCAVPSVCPLLTVFSLQLAGGSLGGLLEALDSMGLRGAVRMLRKPEPLEKLQSTGAGLRDGAGGGRCFQPSRLTALGLPCRGQGRQCLWERVGGGGAGGRPEAEAGARGRAAPQPAAAAGALRGRGGRAAPRPAPPTQVPSGLGAALQPGCPAAEGQDTARPAPLCSYLTVPRLVNKRGHGFP